MCLRIKYCIESKVSDSSFILLYHEKGKGVERRKSFQVRETTEKGWTRAPFIDSTELPPVQWSTSLHCPPLPSPPPPDEITREQSRAEQSTRVFQ